MKFRIKKYWCAISQSSRFTVYANDKYCDNFTTLEQAQKYCDIYKEPEPEEWFDYTPK